MTDIDACGWAAMGVRKGWSSWETGCVRLGMGQGSVVEGLVTRIHSRIFSLFVNTISSLSFCSIVVSDARKNVLTA